MALFSPKRSRATRTGGKAAKTRLAVLLDSLRDRGLVGRTLLVSAAVMAMVCVVEAWRTPFRHREGDFVAHGLAARVDFARLDQTETERQRRVAQEEAPLIFRNDPMKLEGLALRLRSDLGHVSAAEAIEDLAPETRAAFDLESDMGIVSDEVRERFALLKAAVEPKGQLTPEARLDGLITNFRNFITPLARLGVIDPDEVRRLRLRRDDVITVLPPDGGADPGEESLVAATQLADQLADTGTLGSTWLSYPDLNAIREEIRVWLRNQIPPTLTHDPVATKAAKQAAADAVPQVLLEYVEADPLVGPKTVLTAEHLSLLSAEHGAVEERAGTAGRVLRVVLVTLLFAVLAFVNGYYVLRSDPRVWRKIGRLAAYLTSTLLAVAAARLLSFDPARAEVIPLVVTAMVFAIVYNQVLATVMAFTLCLLVTISTTADLRQFVVLMSSTAAAILLTGRVRSRGTLVRVGFLTSVVYVLVFLGMHVLAAQTPTRVLASAPVLSEGLLGGLWCVLCGYFVTGSLPLIEKTFGVVTDISLLELSDPSHPLLQDLVRRAPGTYNHSMSVGSISENAAEAIGANGLLCRVAAYFHDCGKMLKPEYFIENLPAGEESRHDHLAPAMSTLVIIGHVKDGVELAERHNLPQPLIDFIEQHHGTTLVEYFFREAAKQAEGNRDKRTEADEESFRYPGPKPQTREAGVMMLADACESASRAMTDPTPKRLAELVQGLTMKRLLDGQFEECEMTLAEIHKVEEAITKSLTAMYHGRIKYPEAPAKESA